MTHDNVIRGYYYLTILGTDIVNIKYVASPHQIIRKLTSDIVKNLTPFEMRMGDCSMFLYAKIENKRIRLDEDKILADYNLLPGAQLYLVIEKKEPNCCPTMAPITHNATGRNSNRTPFNYTASEQNQNHPIPQRTPFLKRIFRKISGLYSQRDTINSTIFAPSVTERGETMTIQLLLYKDSQYAYAVRKAQQVDPEAKERISQVLGISLKEGDVISAQLTFFPKIEKNHVVIEEATKQVTWRSETEDIVFSVYIDERFSKRLLNGKIVIKVNDIPISEATFCVKVVNYMERQNTLAEVEITKFQKVFISYSHKDADRVQYISETCKAIKCDYFFDRHSLAPGDRYEEKIFKYIDNANLFILCWSENAAASEWVEKERKRALENLEKNNQSLHLYPINIPPRTELPIDMKDTFSFGELM